MLSILSAKQKIAMAGLGLVALIGLAIFSNIGEKDDLEVVFFDVGQGSAIFIETPQNKQILIDGGPDGLEILGHLSQEMPFWDRSIDIIISTHSSPDHLVGLIEVLARYEVGEVIWTGMLSGSQTHQRFKEGLKNAKQRGTKIRIAYLDYKISLETDIYLKILNPLISVAGTDPESHNNNSIVARLAFNEVSFLFTADIQDEAEKALIQKQKDLEQNFLSADILKVPLHGSMASSSLEFLEAVNPSTAIIQVGKENRPGHPHQETLERLNQNKIYIFRTDINGTIRITSDGKSYYFEKQNSYYPPRAI